MSNDRLLLTLVLVLGLGLAGAFCFFLLGNLDEKSPLPESIAQKVDRETAIQGEIAAETALESVPEPGKPRERLTPEGDKRSEEAKAVGIITGRVVNEYNDPVANAQIKVDTRSGITISAHFTMGEDGELVQSDKKDEEPVYLSDDTGRFIIKEVSAGKSLKLAFSHPEHVPASTKIKGFDGTLLDVGDIVLEMGGSISGFVLDEQGRGISGAAIRGRPERRKGGTALFSFTDFMQDNSDWKGESEANGQYRLTGLPEGAAKLTVSHIEYQSVKKEGIEVVKGQETRGIDLTLPLGLILAGRVVDGKNQPISGAEIEARPEIAFDIDNLDSITREMMDNLFPEKTGADGTFLLKGLQQAKHDIKVKAEGFIPATLEKVEAGTQDLLVVMHTGGWLDGRVVDGRTGEAMSAFEVEVDQDEVDDGAITILKAPPPGSFRINGLGAKPFDLEITAEGYGDEKFEGLQIVPPQGDRIEARLVEESILAGRLLDSTGEPVAGGRVKLQVPEAGDQGLPAYVKQEVFIPMEDGRKMPIPRLDRWDRLKSTSSTEAGDFVFRGLKAGTYQLIASHSKHLDSEPLMLDLGPGEKQENLALTLGLAGSIQGRVFDTNKNPLPHTRIQITKIAGGLFSLITSGLQGDVDFSMKNETSTDEGFYVVEGLAPGEYQLRLMPDFEDESIGSLLNSTLSGVLGGSSEGAVTARVAAGEITEVDLFEAAKGGIAGTVTEAGAPVPGLKLKLFPGELGPLTLIPLKTSQSDDRGDYLFKKLPAGKYAIHIELPGQMEALRESVLLEPGNITLKNIVLPSGRISGRVTEAGTGAPLPGMQVSVKTSKDSEEKLFGDAMKISFNAAVNSQGGGGDLGLGDSPPVQTDAGGYYEIPFLADGSYQVSVQGSRRVAQQKTEVKVSAGARTTGQDFSLEAGFTLSGRILESNTGEPATHVPVTVTALDKEQAEKTDSTDGDGGFAFTGLKAGKYRLSWGKTEALELELAQDRTGLELRTP